MIRAHFTLPVSHSGKIADRLNIPSPVIDISKGDLQKLLYPD